MFNMSWGFDSSPNRGHFQIPVQWFSGHFSVESPFLTLDILTDPPPQHGRPLIFRQTNRQICRQTFERKGQTIGQIERKGQKDIWSKNA